MVLILNLQTSAHNTLNNVNHLNRGATTSMQQTSQHKRSLSFNHHLSYNQYSQPTASTVGTLNHKQMIDPNLPHVQMREKPDLPAPGAKTNIKGENDVILHLKYNLFFIFVFISIIPSDISVVIKMVEDFIFPIIHFTLNSNNCFSSEIGLT